MSGTGTTDKHEHLGIAFERSGIRREEKTSLIADTRANFLLANQSVESAIYNIISSNYRSFPVVSQKHTILGTVAVSQILGSFLKDQNPSKKIGNIMTRRIFFADSDDPISLTVQKMQTIAKDGLPVMLKNKLMGTVRAHDIVKYFAHKNLGIKVSSIMTPKPLFVDHDFTTLSASRMLIGSGHGRLPVVKDGTVLGMVTDLDVLKYIRNSEFRISELTLPLSSVVKMAKSSIDKESDISEAVRSMLVAGADSILVVDGGKLEGIVTDYDVIKNIV